MFLVASSVGGVTEPELNAEAKNFFSQSSVLNAQIFLNSLFETEGLDMFASSAIMLSFMHGSLLWKDDLTPSGLAASVLSSQDIIKPNLLEEGIILDYSTKHEMSSSSLEKLTKTQVVYPKDIIKMLDRLKAIHILSKLFFGERSYLENGLKNLVIKCDNNKQMLRVKQHLDRMFIAKFMYAIDKSIFFG